MTIQLLSSGLYKLQITRTEEKAGLLGRYGIVEYTVLESSTEATNVGNTYAYPLRLDGPVNNDDMWSFLRTRTGKTVFAHLKSKEVTLRRTQERVTITMPTFSDTPILQLVTHD